MTRQRVVLEVEGEEQAIEKLIEQAVNDGKIELIAVKYTYDLTIKSIVDQWLLTINSLNLLFQTKQ